VDRLVVEALGAQAVDRGPLGRRRGVRQCQREVAQGARPRGQLGAPVVVRGVLGPVCGALVTEVVGVRARSVGAGVRVRDDDREQLAPCRESCDGPNMISRYSAIDARSTPGRRLIALTMLKTRPARPTAASYYSASAPVASSTSMSRMCATARILALRLPSRAERHGAGAPAGLQNR
jgi:hypothetical protein